MIEPLGDRDIERALQAYRRVFHGTTVMDAPFRPEILGRLLFWPDGHFLTEQQVAALGPATGDDWAYVGGYVFNWTRTDDFDGWFRMGLADAAATYAGTEAEWPEELSHEHVIVGPGGDWGVLLPESGEALFGGTPEVVERFRRLAGIDEDEDVREALAYWAELERTDVRADWMSARLRHLHGPERAARWLAGSAFDPGA